ncbi:S-adenosyl-L-methionine-dependent methyltransferase [Dipodascopsis uninucleata]
MEFLTIAVNNRQYVKKCKSILERNGKFDKLRGISMTDTDKQYLIHTTQEAGELNVAGSSVSSVFNIPELKEIEDSISVIISTQCKNDKKPRSLRSLKSAVTYALASIERRYEMNPKRIDDLASDIPNRYSIYGDLLLLQNTGFENIQCWHDILEDQNIKTDFYRHICKYLKITHIAVNAPIAFECGLNSMRIPSNLVCIYGDFGSDLNSRRASEPLREDFEAEFWAITMQNEIFQTWAPRHTMFSRGNIKEKARVIKFSNIKKKVAIDLYAGIGYFAFSYCAAGADLVLCWEINPWSVEGLLRGAKRNKWLTKLCKRDESWKFGIDKSKIVVFQESNTFAISRIRDAHHDANQRLAVTHINLGLLPTSEPIWKDAVQLALLSSEDSVMLHVHCNIATEDIEVWCKSTKKQFQSYVNVSGNIETNILFEHIELVKSYAPGVMHIVGDFKVQKPLSDN